MAEPMRLTISHKTSYHYDRPVVYALQQLRLTPRSTRGQSVLEWKTHINGASKQAEFDDQFLNHTSLLAADHGTTSIEIVSEGVVEAHDTNGIVGEHRGYAPLWLFQQPSVRTEAGPKVKALGKRVAASHSDADPIATLHALSAEVAKAISYEIGVTESSTTAEEALKTGRGVCQDHAHAMIATARHMGFPARYVSGYLLMDDRVEQDATHAWCEIHTKSLGWVGFDVSNGMCPDARYVRIAYGRDYRDAAPILGIRQGQGAEDLQVSLQVQQ